MKKNVFKNALVACLSFVLFTAIFSACKSNDNTPSGGADKTKLNALIDSCQIIADTVSAKAFKQADIDNFKTTLTATKSAAASTTITQGAVNNLIVSLRAAKATLLGASFSGIPAASLVFALKFDEGSGTQLTTTGAKAWTAVLNAGPSQVFGTKTGLPTFVAGHNATGKAMHFGLGSHLDISNYTVADLLGNHMSISVWVKPDSTRGSNYIISLNTYNTWKFQLQEQNKPFFTVHTTAGFTDADDQKDLSAPNGSWTHLVVVTDLVEGNMNFYVNGAPIMKWTVGTTGNTTKPNLSGTLTAPTTAVPLLIGLETTTLGTPTPTPAGFGYFSGALDDIEYYNIALSDGQVSSLYNTEK